MHALQEIRRVLIPGGILIDLRPLSENWAVEIVSRRDRRQAGRVKDSPDDLENDRVASVSLQTATEAGWYRREQEETFPFNYYWDTPEQMVEFIREEWSSFANLEDEVIGRARSLWAVADADARLRIQLNVLITRWRRLD